MSENSFQNPTNNLNNSNNNLENSIKNSINSSKRNSQDDIFNQYKLNMPRVNPIQNTILTQNNPSVEIEPKKTEIELLIK
jgi:hypothetical protein